MTQTAGNYAKALFELSVPEQALLETEKLLKAESRLCLLYTSDAADE